MKRSTRALLGVGTCWVSAVTFLLPVASLVWHRFDTGPPSPTGRAVFFVLSTLYILLTFGLWLFYLRYVATSDMIEARARGRWVLLLVICPPVMMPSVFFRLVVREPGKRTVGPPADEAAKTPGSSTPDRLVRGGTQVAVFSKRAKWLLGVLTALASLIGLTLYAMLFFSFLVVRGSKAESAVGAFSAGTFMAWVLCYALVAFYVIYALHAPRVSKAERGGWVAALLIVPEFAMPLFYYYYVWCDTE